MSKPKIGSNVRWVRDPEGWESHPADGHRGVWMDETGRVYDPIGDIWTRHHRWHPWETLDWRQRPRDAGQIVGRWFAMVGSTLFKRVFDGADRSTRWYAAEVFPDAVGEFDPGAGSLPDHAEWERVEDIEEAAQILWGAR